jgi:hypothetical protein
MKIKQIKYSPKCKKQFSSGAKTANMKYPDPPGPG